MNRRKFCLSSVAAAISGAAIDFGTAPAHGETAAVAPADSTPRIPFHCFIYDRRYPSCRTFGVAAEHARTTVGSVAIGGDITALWSHDLRLAWSTGGGAIAGMTTFRTLFCLEELAKGHWMRVLIRAEHAIAARHEIAHRLTASEPMIARLRLALAAEDWPAKLPAVLATCPGPDGAPRITRGVRSRCGHRSAMIDETLVSFVIA